MRARNRLPELRRRAGLPAAAPEPEPPLEPPQHLRDTLQQAERVTGWVAEVRRDTAAARALLADTAFHTDARLQERLDHIVTNCNALGLKVCGALRQLEAAGVGVGMGARVARLHAGASRAAYCRALDEHHALLDAARHQQLQLLRQHAQIVNLALTDDECQSLLETDNIALFVDNVRLETAEARLALREAETRHAELKRVEAALVDVRQLFQQLGALVAAQQAAIDTVQHYATDACDRVGEGQAQLLKGTVFRKKTRRKKLWLLICLGSGFFVVILLLMVT